MSGWRADRIWSSTSVCGGPGGKILLAPELVVEYYARAELWPYA